MDFTKLHNLFALEDKLIDTIVALLNLHWIDDDGCCPYLTYENGDVLGADDCESLPIPDTKVTLKSGDSYICDAVLFFGDGCTEFRDKETCDALNWADFEDDSISRVADELIKKLESN